MITEPRETDSLLDAVRRGNAAALAALFEHYAPRLRKMLRLRIGPGVAARIDVSDVLQEAYIDVARKVVHQQFPVAEPGRILFGLF